MFDKIQGLYIKPCGDMHQKRDEIINKTVENEWITNSHCDFKNKTSSHSCFLLKMHKTS